jgi:hypothetical protein
LNIGVVIPALNEAEGIGAVVDAWVEKSTPQDPIRVVVGNNGSNDETAAIAMTAGADVVDEPQRGYGAACLKAIDHLADWPDVVVFAEGDGASDPAQLEDLLTPLRGQLADMVIGWRRAAEPGAMSAPQRAGTALASWLIRLRFGRGCRDLGPFRAITRTALERLEMKDRSWGWTIEMQMKAARRGLRVVEVPVRWLARQTGQSKISGTVLGVIRAGSKILWTFARYAGPGPAASMTAKPIVLMMCKYPTPGQVKTRLAQHLGVDLAARIYRRLAGMAHAAALELQGAGIADVAVCSTGAPPSRFERWLPGACAVVVQPDGDLGRRLRTAFEFAFQRGAPRAVAIGTDCPALDGRRMTAALAALNNADVVVIPAHDGGYALMGLKSNCPALFADIPWSTPDVMAVTRSRAATAGLRICELPPLSDVDTPADLAQLNPLITAVIPVRNEAEMLHANLPGLMRQLHGLTPTCEVLVCDGESTDGSADVAAALGARVVHSTHGRGLQMNAAAQHATGRWLWFVHADCVVPPGTVETLAGVLENDDRQSWGYCRTTIDAPGLAFRVNERLIAARSRCLGLPYGDQGIFVRRRLFFDIGGFPDLPILEDLVLSQHLARQQRPLAAPATIVMSGRRWKTHGYWRTTWTNWRIQFEHIVLGRDCRQLAHRYNTLSPTARVKG